jgi:hypothetical protein
VWWAPFLYLMERQRVLRVSRYDPAEEQRSVLHLRTDPPDLFGHTPVYTPKIENDEELMAVMAKRRMGIVLSQPLTGWRRDAGGQPGEAAFFLAHLYSFHETHPDEFKLRVRAFEYPGLIFSPAEPQNGNRVDGFILLERAQWVARGLMRPANFTLTDEALDVVENWFQYVTTGTMRNPDFLEYRRILMQDLLGRN